MKKFSFSEQPIHGVNIPLFALRSHKSCGIGEFLDLIPIISWCKDLGLSVIQLLPLNDSGTDNSPYGALSAYALNPVYLSLTSLPLIDNPRFAGLQPLISSLQALCQSQRVLYQEVYKQKTAFLHGYFSLAFDTLSRSDEYKQFLKENDSWLHGYSLYKTLLESNLILHFAEFMALCNEGNYTSQINFHCFVQYLCFSQMEKVKSYAEENSVWIKGDIPILVSASSSDVWIHPEIFNQDYSVGAPPDAYSATGQNWGFPLYNWPILKKTRYDWWKQRLKVAEKLYHLYRLDHIVGFFRLWAVPKGRKDGLEGFFIPTTEDQWLEQGEDILHELLSSSNLVPIGEDLGVIPPSTREVLARLKICGTKVMRWERYWNGDKKFIPIEKYPIYSMTTVSTHDSETLQQWWRYCPSEASQYAYEKGWEYVPTLTQEQNFYILNQSNASASIFHINLLNEYFPLVSGLCWPEIDDERINVPSVVSEKNWSYRFKPFVEEIVSHKELADAIVRCITV